MALHVFLSSVRTCLKFPITGGLDFSGQKKDTDVFGATPGPAGISGVVMRTNRSPVGSHAKLMTASLIESTTSTGMFFSWMRKISRFVASDFFDLECRSTLTQRYL